MVKRATKKTVKKKTVKKKTAKKTHNSMRVCFHAQERLR